MVVPGRINFTQLGRYGKHGEQCYRQNFGRRRSKSINWLRFNISLALRYFGEVGRMAIAIDPNFISKAGKKTPHIGRFWSGCAGAVKHGLEIMGKAYTLLAYSKSLRTRFQIEFCYRDAKNYTGLMDCQARAPWKLDFAFNASFASLNIAKLMMKERGMDYSMSNFKALMAGTFLTKRIFDVSRYRPNQTLINHIFKELFGCAA